MRAPADNADRLARRLVFGEAAEDYAAVRPGYPAAVLDWIATHVPLGPETRILEIGCGPGKATRLFAERGCRITALEPDPALADIARRELDEERVRVVEARFEDLRPRPPDCDLVLCAASFHWLDPATRCRDCASMLRPGGGLAVLYNAHPAPYRGFFERAQPIYREVAPTALRDPTATDDQDPLLTELRQSREFGLVVSHSLEWSREYSRDEYLRLLNTYSDHRRLDADRRAMLFDRLGRLIDAEYGGSVIRPYRSVLHLAVRPTAPDHPGNEE